MTEAIHGGVQSNADLSFNLSQFSLRSLAGGAPFKARPRNRMNNSPLYQYIRLSIPELFVGISLVGGPVPSLLSVEPVHNGGARWVSSAMHDNGPYNGPIPAQILEALLGRDSSH